MNAKQRKILITFKKLRQHVSIEGCPDPDCRKEFQKAIWNIVDLASEAERTESFLSKRKAQRLSEVK